MTSRPTNHQINRQTNKPTDRPPNQPTYRPIGQPKDISVHSYSTIPINPTEFQYVSLTPECKEDNDEDDAEVGDEGPSDQAAQRLYTASSLLDNFARIWSRICDLD